MAVENRGCQMQDLNKLQQHLAGGVIKTAVQVYRRKRD